MLFDNQLVKDLPMEEQYIPIIDWQEECGTLAIPVSSHSFFFLMKRVMDIVLAVFLVIVLFPFLILIALVIKLTSPGPAFFVQERIGKDGGVFRMYKFRTMVNGSHKIEDKLAEESGSRIFFKMKTDPRITTFGRFLRKFSLDELPQIFNVLFNNMSLVGPRPLLLSDFDKFPRDRQLRRFAMKPGITGLWQVKGRNDLTDNERIELDCKYVDEWSIIKDMTILLETIPAVISGKGAY
jgi:lipopolysaccharide/colanic/teichoic acid biosynthesis glycosyltransferase